MSDNYEWLPVSIAPKDGREFLVRMPRCGDVVSLVYWTKIHKQTSVWFGDKVAGRRKPRSLKQGIKPCPLR